ncbi:MAG TPA: hypothetical protein DEE98_07295 [Elusimicrobia bacterium]|nr:MAG: hypothetical protein A2386_08780 [Elusimicrobia bacterium RIFOXYB1_FULL_48_9]OGS15832.1 MAG: hypothetical protein A2251_04205 [Elusimicrobia bacterium RIFOXYA2_FULL_47_53]HBU70170.1 hypothetical protein [Elusimicrobiota bacterium]
MVFKIAQNMKIILSIKLKSIRNKIVRMSLGGEIKAALMLITACAFILGIYAGAWRLLKELNSVQLIGPLLTNKLLALVFLTSFSMVIISSLIASFNTLFSSRDLPWLMTKPLGVRGIFVYKAFETIFYSSWMVLLLLIPFVGALGSVKHLSFWFYVSGFVLTVPFLVISGSLGIFLCLILMKLLPRRKTRDILLFSGVMFVTGIYILLRFLQPERLLRPDALELVSQYLRYLDAPTAPYLPSWWLTAGILASSAGSLKGVALNSALLYGCAALLFATLILFARKYYFEGWASAQIFGGSGQRRTNSYVKRMPLQAFFRKDLTIFFRDASQWSQLVLLGALIVVYLFSLYKLPLETLYIQNLVTYFNLGLIGFMLSAVALRFVFPSVSLEGESLWLVRSFPFSPAKFIFEKLVYGSLPMVIFGSSLVIFSGFILKADMALTAIFALAVTIMGLGLCSMAVGLGSIFPKYDSTNVSEIESSPGGLLFMVSALFYLLVNMGLWAIPIQNYYSARNLSYGLPWVAGGLLAVNLIAVVLPLRFGLKSLESGQR